MTNNKNKKKQITIYLPPELRLFNQIHVLTNQMDELMQKGWKEVKKE